ncbi:hypothetical protein NHF46_04955 [Arthrobacter alpinus]|nr:hypothetical protein [Arthrobacter alpinus]
MQELRNLPRWALIFSSCVAVIAVAFVVMGVVDLLTGAGTDRLAMDVLAAAAFAFAAWSIAVKGNPSLSRGRDEAPNRRSPLEW